MGSRLGKFKLKTYIFTVVFRWLCALELLEHYVFWFPSSSVRECLSNSTVPSAHTLISTSSNADVAKKSLKLHSTVSQGSNSF